MENEPKLRVEDLQLSEFPSGDVGEAGCISDCQGEDLKSSVDNTSPEQEERAPAVAKFPSSESPEELYNAMDAGMNSDPSLRDSSTKTDIVKEGQATSCGGSTDNSSASDDTVDATTNNPESEADLVETDFGECCEVNTAVSNEGLVDPTVNGGNPEAADSAGDSVKDTFAPLEDPQSAEILTQVSDHQDVTDPDVTSGSNVCDQDESPDEVCASNDATKPVVPEQELPMLEDEKDSSELVAEEGQNSGVGLEDVYSVPDPMLQEDEKASDEEQTKQNNESPIIGESSLLCVSDELKAIDVQPTDPAVESDQKNASEKLDSETNGSSCAQGDAKDSDVPHTEPMVESENDDVTEKPESEMDGVSRVDDDAKVVEVQTTEPMVETDDQNVAESEKGGLACANDDAKVVDVQPDDNNVAGTDGPPCGNIDATAVDVQAIESMVESDGNNVTEKPESETDGSACAKDQVKVVDVQATERIGESARNDITEKPENEAEGENDMSPGELESEKMGEKKEVSDESSVTEADLSNEESAKDEHTKDAIYPDDEEKRDSKTEFIVSTVRPDPPSEKGDCDDPPILRMASVDMELARDGEKSMHLEASVEAPSARPDPPELTRIQQVQESLEKSVSSISNIGSIQEPSDEKDRDVTAPEEQCAVSETAGESPIAQRETKSTAAPAPAASPEKNATDSNPPLEENPIEGNSSILIESDHSFVTYDEDECSVYDEIVIENEDEYLEYVDEILESESSEAFTEITYDSKNENDENFVMNGQVSKSSMRRTIVKSATEKALEEEAARKKIEAQKAQETVEFRLARQHSFVRKEDDFKRKLEEEEAQHIREEEERERQRIADEERLARVKAEEAAALIAKQEKDELRQRLQQEEERRKVAEAEAHRLAAEAAAREKAEAEKVRRQAEEEEQRQREAKKKAMEEEVRQLEAQLAAAKAEAEEAKKKQKEEKKRLKAMKEAHKKAKMENAAKAAAEAAAAAVAAATSSEQPSMSSAQSSQKKKPVELLASPTKSKESSPPSPTSGEHPLKKKKSLFASMREAVKSPRSKKKALAAVSPPSLPDMTMPAAPVEQVEEKPRVTVVAKAQTKPKMTVSPAPPPPSPPPVEVKPAATVVPPHPVSKPVVTPVVDETDKVYYTPDQLRNQSVPGLDYKNREIYLSPAAFQELFGMDAAAFNELPKWKRTKMKRSQKLF